jgi:hypothetical protein
MQPTNEDRRETTVTTLPTLAQVHFHELNAIVRGELYRRGDSQYVTVHVWYPLGIVLIHPSVILDFTNIHACSTETF